MDGTRDWREGSPDFAGSDAEEESWDWHKGSPDFAGSDAEESWDLYKGLSSDFVVSNFNTAGPALFEAAKLAYKKYMESLHPAPPPNPQNPPMPDLNLADPPKPDTAAFEMFVREELEKQLDVVMKRFSGVEITVDRVLETSVRNESHMKLVEEQFKAYQKSMLEFVKSTKESLSLEMKVLLEAQMKELKALLEKSTVQQMDAFLKDVEAAASFPVRIYKLTQKALYVLSVLEILFYLASREQAVPPEVAGKLKVVKPKLDQLASKLEELPKKCKSIQLQKGKFTDLGRTSAELLHSFFQSGPDSGCYLSYSADATAGALAMIYGDGVADSGFLKLKTKATRDLTVVRGTFSSSRVDYYGVIRPSFSVSLPASWASVHYLHEYGGLLASVQRGPNPLDSLSCVFGFKAFSLGADLGFNPVDKLWTKYEAGLRCNTSGLDIALLTKNKMDQISASVCYRWGESVSVGFENRFTLSTKVHEMIVGLSRCLDPMTTLKARIGLKARLRKPDDPEDGKLLFDKSAVGGLALLRRWGTCAGGVSVEVDLQKNMAPRFGLFLKFGAPKSAARLEEVPPSVVE